MFFFYPQLEYETDWCLWLSTKLVSSEYDVLGDIGSAVNLYC